ncbi:acetolactate synthase [Aphanothece hegewaldii CCALA 016]|uniref:Acetolactate synthase n=1 Tax=Aphanothece hegewaldii CCALA 016 TaxID=2107694 RepID=A0A2T1M1G1_9CHRO|nr:thiamine pyrophosphate-binding protein [Aphanothece hegewaldii]PSF38504.1 acetolactate synthase [Aphanothece hegewaldii CCALA 016]
MVKAQSRLTSQKTISAKNFTFDGNGETISVTVAQAIVKVLENLGVRQAFGVSGGAMATLWAALSNSPLIQVIHCRHEGGAAFAATEAYFASNRPVVVFTTAGPGITNALTGLLAARDEGAKVIHLSACTSAPQRGRWAIQETSNYTLPQEGIFTSGTLFHEATVLESPKQLPQIARRLALGLAGIGGFVAHISIPTGVQSMPSEIPLPYIYPDVKLSVPSNDTILEVAQLLQDGSFAIWVGFGARHAADLILQLAEITGAAVMCSPRGKGIFPESHPQFVGVTGVGGHESVMQYLHDHSPRHILVLGTRLGEPTSFWSEAMIPPEGFIHVDIDPKVPGVAYPMATTYPVIADVEIFVEALLDALPIKLPQILSFPNPETIEIDTVTEDLDLVRPEVLIEAIQRIIVDGSDALVLAESGNSFTWSTHLLRFDQPHRYRVSTGVGSMGHNVTGVVGAALGRGGKAVAIVGDGAMLMNSEVSTAVKYQVPAVWIVLNDARYNMCYQGMSLLGLTGADATIPQADFAAIANGMGAEGIRLERESDLETVLHQAMAISGPVVIDVCIDPMRLAPSKGRNKSLSVQGIKATKEEKQISFPLV